MKLSQLVDLIRKETEVRLDILTCRGHDYADPERDILKNFREVSKVCCAFNINPQDNPTDAALFFLVHKVQRLCNLRDKPPQSESVIDTIRDIHNYVDLVWANLLNEEDMRSAIKRNFF